MLTSAAGGPLAWVHPEIEVALGEVERALADADWTEAASRIGVLAHLHQVSGALSMVGLAGPQRLAEELEQVLGQYQTQPDASVCAVVNAAIGTLRADLALRLAGKPARDLDGLPALQDLGKLRQLRYGTIELFFPELAALPSGSAAAPVEQARQCRAAFQRGLLAALRFPESEQYRQPLAAALRRVAETAPGRFGAARWTVLAEVLATLGDEDDQDPGELRRLYVRIDRQLRANGSSEDQDNPRLLREALLLASRLAAPSPVLEQMLRDARVEECFADLPADSAPLDAAPAPGQQVLVDALREAEERLEAWFRGQSADPLPAQVGEALARAAAEFDAQGEDAALLLLEDARARLQHFPLATEVSESLLEPVAEALAGLHHYAAARLAGDPLAERQLERLRSHLLSLSPSASEPAPSSASLAPDLVAHHIDETLLPVFLEEADTLLRGLNADAAHLLDHAESASVARLRAALQTLRGSGLMAGLLPLAQLCGELDHTLAAWTPRGTPAWEAPARLVEESTRAMGRWLALLATDRSMPLPAVALIDRARELRAQPRLSLAPLISLQDIFLEEAADRIADLRQALGADRAHCQRPGEALRAVHTLAGIARTAGHPGMAELARAMESVFEALRADSEPAARNAAHERLHAAVLVLADMHASLVAGRALQPAEEWVRAMRRDVELLVARPAAPELPLPQVDANDAGTLDSSAQDQPDPDLLPVFLEECAELLPMLDAALRACREGAGVAQGSAALKRGLHTLKGSARMSGLLRQGALAHRLEDQVARLGSVSGAEEESLLDTIQTGLDALALGIEALASPHPAGHGETSTIPAEAAAAPAEPVLAGDALAIPSADTLPAPADFETPASVPAVSPPDVVPHAIVDEVALDEVAVVPAAALPDTEGAAAVAAASTGETPTPPAPVQIGALPPIDAPRTEEAERSERPVADTVSPVLRIRVESLDRMANAAGEAGIGRARLETEAGALKRGLSDLAENIQRLKSQLREIEIHAERALPANLPEASARHGFDPLEMDRYSRLQELASTLTEGIDDVQTVHQGLRRGLDEMELALRQQGRVIRDLQQDLLRARMVPFASLAERLQRTTRQAARECGCDLMLQVEGAQHEVDRSILERLAAPLEHLLRNAAAHGIEPAEVRRDVGKATQGRLTIHLTPGEHEVSLRISDDGRGIDLSRVRVQAETQGLLPPGTACSDEELLQLIFRPGFSTARSVTSLAGRGVGLDVVRSEVLGLGGRIHLDTRPGQGTDFTLVIPVTLATVQAVVVRAGDDWFAIPAPLVEQVRPVAREALADLYRERVAVWKGLRYPFTSLTRVLGLDRGEPEPQGTQQLVFLRSADRRCALRVDELTGTQEIVVKTVSPHLARIPGVTGASVLGNGRIVLILNPVPLAVGVDGLIPEALLPAETLPEVPTVMVVDDSITVRRVTTRLLERAGYQVSLAKDGLDALEQLADALPQALLLDVEMPRMDGFELIARLRADERTRHLPVIVITSRTAERHRAHAESLGVQGYLGKPYREEDLLARLAALLRPAGSAETAAAAPASGEAVATPPAPVLSLVR